MGLIFLGLFSWAKSNPFAASLTALFIYITFMLIGCAIDPTSLGRSFIVEIIISLALVSGVKSGLALEHGRSR